MGSVLVQILRARGAHVVGAARGKAKLDAVATAGAEAVIDYSQPDWTGVLLEATSGARPRWRPRRGEDRRHVSQV
jgi:NADPH2:quinone reductase